MTLLNGQGSTSIQRVFSVTSDSDSEILAALQTVETVVRRILSRFGSLLG